MVTTSLGGRPWASIDPAIASVLRKTLPMLIDRTLEHIERELPSLGKDLAGPYGVALRRGIEEALEHFLALLGHDVDALDDGLTELYRSFGAREDHHGRSLETLLTAYRYGARISWTHYSAAAVAAGVATDQVIRLAEAIFAYVDELSAASALGFAQAQVERAGRRDRVRRQLADAVLDGEAGTLAPRVNDLAAEAGWPLPELLAVAVSLPAPPGAARALAPHPDVLVVSSEEEVRALVPEPVLRRGRAGAPVLGSGPAWCVGTVRPPEQAPISLAHARATGSLVQTGVIPGSAVVFASDHLPALLLHADRRLLSDLRARVLEPLAQVPASRRAVMTQTLRSWLAHQGERGATSRDLAVHPQTVSYRMTELRRLFGDALDQPEGRFPLALALHDLPGGDLF